MEATERLRRVTRTVKILVTTQMPMEQIFASTHPSEPWPRLGLEVGHSSEIQAARTVGADARRWRACGQAFRAAGPD